MSSSKHTLVKAYFDRDTATYRCEICSKTFVSAQDIWQHFKQSAHHNWCHRCDKHFILASGLEQHSVAKHNMAQCHTCSRLFETTRILLIHTRQIHHSCGICNRAFGSVDAVKDHLRHSTAHAWCESCDIDFSDHGKLEKHQQFDHSSSDGGAAKPTQPKQPHLTRSQAKALRRAASTTPLSAKSSGTPDEAESSATAARHKLPEAPEQEQRQPPAPTKPTNIIDSEEATPASISEAFMMLPLLPTVRDQTESSSDAPASQFESSHGCPGCSFRFSSAAAVLAHIERGACAQRSINVALLHKVATEGSNWAQFVDAHFLQDLTDGEDLEEKYAGGARPFVCPGGCGEAFGKLSGLVAHCEAAPGHCKGLLEDGGVREFLVNLRLRLALAWA